MAKTGRRHRRLAMLGEGGMAQVFLTLTEGLAGSSKLVVVKQLRPELAANEEYLRMFLDEARLTLRLSHANIVQTYEVESENDQYFLTMEYLEGQPLLYILKAVGRTKVPRAIHLHVILQILSGLAYAHDLSDFSGAPLNIVHRDISPHNVFVTYDGQVKVVDFGIAKAASSLEQTQSGVFKGKTTYACPEQALAKPVDRRADVFSTGVLLWEAVCQQRMWAGRAEAQILVDLVNGDIPKVDETAPGSPRELVAIIEKAVHRNPEERYANAGEFHDALDAYAKSSGETASSKELAAFMIENFREERSRIRAVVERQTRAQADKPNESLGDLPVLLSIPPGADATLLLTATSSAPTTAATAASRTPWLIAGLTASLLVVAVAVFASVRRSEAAANGVVTAGVAGAATSAPTPTVTVAPIASSPASPASPVPTSAEAPAATGSAVAAATAMTGKQVHAATSAKVGAAKPLPVAGPTSSPKREPKIDEESPYK